ncbi:MAG: glycosyltransferase [Lachnospiraceae bacterium]
MISVIVPVYNAEKYLDACVESILAQDYKDFELLLVDDGATDASGIICDRWCEKDNHIRVFHRENGGAAKARNFGVSMAGGEYVAFVDSDDVIAKSYLKTLQQLAEKTAADIAVCGFVRVFPDGKETKLMDEAKDKSVVTGPEKTTDVTGPEKTTGMNCTEGILVMTGPEAMERLLYQRDFMSVPWGMISRKALWDEVAFPEGTKAEDMGTIYRLFAKAKTLVYTGAPLYEYYQRADNTIFSTSRERNVDYLMHANEMVAYVERNFPEYLPAAKSRLFSACFQILSETEKCPENQEILTQVYTIIRRLRRDIQRDKKTKMRNRGAAVLAVFGVGGLHRILRMYYKKQCKKLAAKLNHG